MALLVLATTAARARIIAPQLGVGAPIRYRRLVIMTAIRSVHMGLRICDGLRRWLGFGHDDLFIFSSGPFLQGPLFRFRFFLFEGRINLAERGFTAERLNGQPCNFRARDKTHGGGILREDAQIIYRFVHQ